MRWMRLLVVSLLLLGITPGFAHAETYTVVSSSDTHYGPITRTETVIQVGSNPLNRFTIHRVRKNIPGHAMKGSMLLLPPLGPASFNFYEFTLENDYLRSFAAFYALRNYDVWGYSLRNASVPPGTCEQPGNLCSVMQDWNMQTVLDDLEYVKGRIQTAHPGQKPVVGGHSLGAMLSTAAINATPADYRGLILWEGSIYTNDATIQTLNQQWCGYWQNQLAQGIYHDTGAQGFRALAALALTLPNDPTPVPGFPPGTTNRQAFVIALTSATPGPLLLTPGFVLAAGDPQAAMLYFAREERVQRAALQFVDYTPTALGRDLSCGLAGERIYTGQLSAYTGPIYVIQAGRGSGDTVTETAQATGSTDIRYNRVDVFGHIDHWATDAHRHFVERPILHWLDTAVFR